MKHHPLHWTALHYYTQMDFKEETLELLINLILFLKETFFWRVRAIKPSLLRVPVEDFTYFIFQLHVYSSLV